MCVIFKIEALLQCPHGWTQQGKVQTVVVAAQMLWYATAVLRNNNQIEHSVLHEKKKY